MIGSNGTQDLTFFLDSSPAQKGSNPFGAARPIDTSAKEKEIEQKLKETHIRDQPNKPREQRKEPVKKVHLPQPLL